MICPALGVSPTDRPSQNKFSTLVANKWSTTVSLDELKKEKKYIFGLHFHYEVKSRVIYTTTTNHYCVGSFKQHQREWGDLKWSASSICRMFLTLWLHKRFWVKIVFWILWMLSSTWHPPFPWPPAHTMDLSSTGTNLPFTLLQALCSATGSMACWRVSAALPPPTVLPHPTT